MTYIFGMLAWFSALIDMKKEPEIILELKRSQVLSLILIFKKKVDNPEIGCFFFLTGLINSRFSYYNFFSPFCSWFYDSLFFYVDKFQTVFVQLDFAGFLH